MTLRIEKIDYEAKIITLDGPFLPEPGTIPARAAFSVDGKSLTIGCTVVGDGLDENAMFINPRRMK